ncbi:testican-1-like [Ostrea edulis]|uniref:testican-1-like n=1 Tax=Ostrea edulis TaxID=37623 RepID=UPI0024AF1D4C|nr:testican-1-like [Ostrea edulis]XP_056018210.1 testican-1-like [Ostrea edulis]
MDGKVVLCLLVICFTVLEANRHGYQFKKNMWRKGFKEDKDLKFKLFTRGTCLEGCKKSEVCVKEKGSKKSVCLARHIVRDSRRLLRKSQRLGNRSHHQRNRFQGFRKHQRYGLETRQKNAMEFSKFHDKRNVIRKKHDRTVKPKNFVKFSKDRDFLEKMEGVKELMERTHQMPNHRHVCGKKDLEKMRGRLQGWFVTLHEQYHEEKNHHITKRSLGDQQADGKCHCIKSVMWQFHQMDKNKDHHLDKFEMSEMESNHKESCIRPFMGSCDTDGDSLISKQEWCCCFHADAPCHVAQKEAREGRLLGATTPRCTVEGYFKRMQCNASTGFCWCADLNGNEIRGTRLSMRKGEPHCGKFDALGRVKMLKERKMN